MKYEVILWYRGLADGRYTENVFVRRVSDEAELMDVLEHCFDVFYVYRFVVNRLQNESI